MKFGKSLSIQIEETLPEWKDKFLSYKDLKKRLKNMENRPEKRRRIESGDDDKESHFMELLERELDKFNEFFEEKEEEYIIILKDFQDRIAKANDSSEEKLRLHKEIVDFHGEMVLLENYSALNYTGLVKILKKYDKRTGALLRSPFIQKVLQQPFFTTDLLFKLVKECETLLDQLFPIHRPAMSSEPSTSYTTLSTDELFKRPKDIAAIEYIESLYLKSTITALKGLEEIRSKSSTVSAFSLPPLQMSGVEEVWNKAPVLEQLAK